MLNGYPPEYAILSSRLSLEIVYVSGMHGWLVPAVPGEHASISHMAANRRVHGKRCFMAQQFLKT